MSGEGVRGTCGREWFTRTEGGTRRRRYQAVTETLSWRGVVEQLGTTGEAVWAPFHLHSSINPTSHRRSNFSFDISLRTPFGKSIETKK